MAVTVFILQHLHVIDDGSEYGKEDVKLIGVYSSLASAQDAVRRLASMPGFKDAPEIRNPEIDDEEDGFYIDEYEIDRDHWEEGFFTVQ